MKPISGYIELPLTDQIEKRRAEISNGVSGLGPADLVVLTKKGDSQFSTYYFLSGVPFSDEESVKSYFKEISAKRPHKMLGKFQYSLIGIQIFVWNPFSSQDVHLSLDKENNFSVKVFDKDSNEIDISTQIWDEIAISSLLRFWIPYDDLFRAIYNLKRTNCHPLYVPQSVPPFRNDQLQYIFEKLDHSSDSENALALYFLATLPQRDFYAAISQYRKRCPRLISSILRYVPMNSSIAEKLADPLILCFYQTPDDMTLAKTMVDLSYARHDKTRTGHVVPFLKNTMWSSPVACMCCARSFITNKKYDEAMFFLNAAFYAREFKLPVKEEYNPEKPDYPSGRAPRPTPRSIEKELIEVQLDEANDCIHSIIYELCDTYGAMRLKGALKYKLPQTADGKTVYNEFHGNTKNVVEENTYGSELDLLFDPGITSQTTIPPSFTKLPLSTILIDLVNQIVTETQELSQAKRSGSVSSQENARYVATVALKSGDKEAFKIAMDYFQKHWRLRPIHFLMEMGIWAKAGGDLPKMPEYSKKLTFGERNALVVIEKVASNLSNLIQAEKAQ